METKNKKIVSMDLKQYGMFLILIGIFLLFALTPLTLLVGMQTSTATMENSVEMP